MLRSLFVLSSNAVPLGTARKAFAMLAFLAMGAACKESTSSKIWR